jgi:hypothetical protein
MLIRRMARTKAGKPVLLRECGRGSGLISGGATQGEEKPLSPGDPARRYVAMVRLLWVYRLCSCNSALRDTLLAMGIIVASSLQCTAHGMY